MYFVCLQNEKMFEEKGQQFYFFKYILKANQE